MILWQVELIALTGNSRHVIMNFVAQANDGEDAVDIVLKEHRRELKDMEIEIESYHPLGKKSIFIDWKDHV